MALSPVEIMGDGATERQDCPARHCRAGGRPATIIIRRYGDSVYLIASNGAQILDALMSPDTADRLSYDLGEAANAARRVEGAL